MPLVMLPMWIAPLGEGGGGGGTLVTEDFTGSNGDPLNSNWTVTLNTWEIQSNAAHPTTLAAYNLAYWDADAFADDQYAEATLPAGSVADGTYVGPAVRVSGSSGYVLMGDTDEIYLIRLDTGTPTILESYAEGLASGGMLRLEISGTNLHAYKGVTSLGTHSDATHASGSAGIVGYANGPQYIDSWEGGDL